jgi:hypothetical protein
MTSFFVSKDSGQRILALPLVSGTVARHYTLTGARRKDVSRTVVMPAPTPFKHVLPISLNSFRSTRVMGRQICVSKCQSAGSEFRVDMISTAAPKYMHRGNLRA